MSFVFDAALSRRSRKPLTNAESGRLSDRRTAKPKSLLRNIRTYELGTQRLVKRLPRLIAKESIYVM